MMDNIKIRNSTYMRTNSNGVVNYDTESYNVRLKRKHIARNNQDKQNKLDATVNKLVEKENNISSLIKLVKDLQKEVDNLKNTNIPFIGN